MYAASAMPGGGNSLLACAGDVAIPLLLIFGDEDYYVPRHDMDRLSEALKAGGKDFRMQIYPDVGHSFFRHGSPQAISEVKRYSDEAVAQAVADSWNLVRVFLQDIFSRSPAHAAVTGDIHTGRTEPARH
jgi:dienelactone hydrolase